MPAMKAPFLCVLLFLAKSQASKDQPHVIVVGSGPSGIAAATKLLENNFSVQVLEAEDRFGGRVHSVSFGDGLIDLGAQWIHGQNNNVVYEMVKDLNIVEEGDINPTFYVSDRKKISNEVQAEILTLFEDVYASAKDGNDSVSVGEYFLANYIPQARSNYKNDNETLELALAMVDCWHKMILSLEGAFSWLDTTAKSDYQFCEGHQNVNWQGKGYKTILDLLMKPHPTFKPKLNSKVDKIESTEQGCKVHVGKETFDADHVIFTPSIGVLKDNYASLFSPKLSDEKVKAVKALGFGAVIKVFVEFPERWWPKEGFEGAMFVWKDSDKLKLKEEFPRGPSKNENSWLLNFMGVMDLPKNEKVFLVWFTGELVPEIENMPEDLLIDGVMFVLKKFFEPKYTVPEPTKILRTNWYNNPNFRGTYSFQTVESRTATPKSSNVILSEPIVDEGGVPRVLFAGEATSPHHYGTVHGAIETGWREAGRIINQYKK